MTDRSSSARPPTLTPERAIAVYTRAWHDAIVAREWDKVYAYNDRIHALREQQRRR